MKESVVTNPRDAWERDRSVTEALWPDILLQRSLETVYCISESVYHCDDAYYAHLMWED